MLDEVLSYVFGSGVVSLEVGCSEEGGEEGDPGEADAGEADDGEADASEADTGEADTGETDAGEDVGEDFDEVVIDGEEEAAVEESVKIYAYERMRNERVVERMAEFERRWPDFEKDVRSLKVVKAVRRKKPKVQQPVSRRSSRVQKTSQIGNIEEESIEIREDGDIESDEEEPLVVTEIGDNESGGGNAAEVTEAGDNIVEEEGPLEVIEPGNITSVEANLGDVGIEDHETGARAGAGRFVCVPCGYPFRYSNIEKPINI